MRKQHSRPISSKSRLGGIFDDFLRGSWWVIFFVLICFAAHEQGVRHLRKARRSLAQEQEALIQEKAKMVKAIENLELQINSQSDYAWVELTLIKGLGVVPKGQRKVYFKRPTTIAND